MTILEAGGRTAARPNTAGEPILPLALALAAIAATLLAEVLLLSYRFDMPAADLGGAISAIPRLVSPAVRGLPMVVVLVLLLRGRALLAGLRGRVGRLPVALNYRRLAGHLAAFGGFAWATTVLCGPIGRSAPQALRDPLILAWLTLGIACPLTLFEFLAPIRQIAAVVVRDPLTWITGIALAALSQSMGMAGGGLWATLGRATLGSASAILRAFHDNAVVDPSTMKIGLGDFVVRVAPECSGYQGMGMMAAFLAAYLVFRRRDLRFPRAWLLLPMGVALAWAFNVLRIVALVEVGRWYSPEVAVGGFHSQAGWLAFDAIGLATIGLARLRVFRRDDGREAAPVAARSEVVPYMAPFAALLAATMVTQAFNSGFDALYPLRIAAVAAALWACPRREGSGPLVSWSWPALAGGVVVFALWMALERPDVGGASAASPVAGLPAWAAVAWVALRTIGSVVTVPIAEELAFRGYLMRRLASSDFAGLAARHAGWIAVLVSSCLFGALHSRWLAGALAGVIYACVYRHRGRIGDAVVAHALTNLLIAGTVVATGAYSLWN